MSFDPYLDLETGVLRNKLGISDRDELARAEADLTVSRLYDLRRTRLPGRYDLAHARHLRDLDRAAFVDQLTELLADINALHPFREGNGRTQRAFLAQLARDAGHRIRWTGMDPVANIAASRASLGGDNTLLRAMLDQLVDQVGPCSVPAPRPQDASE